MRKSRITTEQIIGFIKEAEASMAVAELGRQHGFSPASFYAWRWVITVREHLNKRA